MANCSTAFLTSTARICWRIKHFPIIITYTEFTFGIELLQFRLCLLHVFTLSRAFNPGVGKGLRCRQTLRWIKYQQLLY